MAQKTTAKKTMAEDPHYTQALQSYELGLRAMQEHKFDKAKPHFQKIIGEDVRLADEIDGLADMEAQFFGRHETGRQFAGMEAYVHLGIQTLGEIEHLHLQMIVAHRDSSILGLNKVDARHAWIR